MPGETRTLARVSKRLKNFQADARLFSILEDASALLRTAGGKGYPESRIIRDVLVLGIAAYIREMVPRLIEAHLAGMTEAERVTEEKWLREDVAQRLKTLERKITDYQTVRERSAT